MGKSKSITIGYAYYFGLHMGISRGPINELVELRVAEKTAWKGRFTGNGRIQINARDLFGGEKGEGGIEGPLDIYMGYDTQVSVPGLESMVGEARPGFRGRCTAFFDGLVCMLNPYPKAWSWRVRRTTEGWDGAPWYPTKAKIVLTRPVAAGEVTSEAEIHAMNPAHILYECLTNRDWGRGLSPTRLNGASFIEAADRLYAENFGLCLRWVRRDSLKNFIQGVIDHVGAALYSDRTTGLLTLKLIRFDYNANDLPLFDADSGLLSVEEAPVAALGPMVNEFTVAYTDPLTNKEQSVTVQNLASLQANGGTFNSIKKDYKGLPVPDLALRVAQRELRIASTGLRRFKVKLDRRAWKLAPAGLFRIRDLSRGIPDTVLRIGRIEGGTLLNGTITITAMTDVFALPLTSYVQPAPPVKQQSFEPMPTDSAVFEVPYASLARYVPASDFAYISNVGGYLGVVAAKPSPIHGGFDIGIRNGLPTIDDQPISGSP